MKRIRMLLIVAVVVIGVAGAFYSRRWERRENGAILLSGNIELTQINIAFKTPGRLIEINVDEGAPIKKGMVVARLDAEQIKQQRGREQAGVTGVESQLAQLRTAILWQKETLAAEKQLRQAEVNQAEARLQELLAGARKQEIRLAQAAAEEARTQHAQAKKDWERSQALFKNDDISSAQYDQFKLRYEATRAALTQVEERLAMVVEGPRHEEIELARAQVARAKAAMRLSEANQMELRRKEQETDARRAEIERAQAQVAIADTQMEDTTAKSPIDGVVLVKAAEVGQVVAAGTTVVTVGDIDHPWLRGYINEKDLGRVKLGAKVKVTTDSYPGKVYWGRVAFIASEAEFTPKQIQTPEERVKLVHRIKIDLSNPQQELKLNMTADAEIALDKP
ncbi:MAG: efflux RND transporter periplasmic adaptor subunit [Acidobacteria bacterium]|nr:efflux RND transporter periplasmic adaptor subunit [Acidobacteriota bacterium]MBI3654819.1 efflux RND transporter periplasmic adaptor subunit [Acidobacteriota bacterium]